MNILKNITHIIYDMDGLLLDTEPFYTEVTQSIVGRYGKIFDWSVKSQMLGKRSIDASRILVDVLDIPLSAEQYLEECELLLEDLFPTTQPLPGAVKITQYLKSYGIPQAVATSSDHRMFKLKTANHQKWFSIFDSVITGDSPGIEHGKPAPDIFLKAANQLGANPEQCLVFEDAPSGIEAALRANMQVIAIPDPNMEKSLFKKAHVILNSLYEFQTEVLGIPTFDSNYCNEKKCQSAC